MSPHTLGCGVRTTEKKLRTPIRADPSGSIRQREDRLRPVLLGMAATGYSRVGDFEQGEGRVPPGCPPRVSPGRWPRALRHLPHLCVAQASRSGRAAMPGPTPPPSRAGASPKTRPRTPTPVSCSFCVDSHLRSPRPWQLGRGLASRGSTPALPRSPVQHPLPPLLPPAAQDGAPEGWSQAARDLPRGSG